MSDLKSIFKSKTLVANFGIALLSVGVSFELAPPTLLGCSIGALAVLSSHFRIKATTQLV